MCVFWKNHSPSRYLYSSVMSLRRFQPTDLVLIFIPMVSVSFEIGVIAPSSSTYSGFQRKIWFISFSSYQNKHSLNSLCETHQPMDPVPIDFGKDEGSIVRQIDVSVLDGFHRRRTAPHDSWETQLTFLHPPRNARLLLLVRSTRMTVKSKSIWNSEAQHQAQNLKP